MGVHRLRNHVGRAEGRHEADVGGIGHLQESRKLSQSAYCRAMRPTIWAKILPAS
jgi:hypothetical protein